MDLCACSTLRRRSSKAPPPRTVTLAIDEGGASQVAAIATDQQLPSGRTTMADAASSYGTNDKAGMSRTVLLGSLTQAMLCCRPNGDASRMRQ
jgi:hypothetical protein